MLLPPNPIRHCVIACKQGMRWMHCYTIAIPAKRFTGYYSKDKFKLGFWLSICKRAVCRPIKATGLNWTLLSATSTQRCINLVANYSFHISESFTLVGVEKCCLWVARPVGWIDLFRHTKKHWNLPQFQTKQTFCAKGDHDRSRGTVWAESSKFTVDSPNVGNLGDGCTNSGTQLVGLEVEGTVW